MLDTALSLARLQKRMLKVSVTIVVDVASKKTGTFIVGLASKKIVKENAVDGARGASGKRTRA